MNSQKTETDENSSSSAGSFEVNKDSILCKDFDILDNIGKGAFAAAVFKVRNRLDGKLYAIKVIPCEKLNEEIPKEIEFLSELDHPNVVSYCSSWTDGANNKKKEDYDKDSESSDDWIKFERGSCDEKTYGNVNTEDVSPTSTNSNDLCICMYIQMEFCETTLRNAIDGISNMPLSLDEDEVQLYLNENPNRILRLITHIVKGLAYIHSEGIIHRDLKPENILIDRNDLAKIGDFGLATWNNALVNGKASHTGEVGTPMYDAPELDILCSGSKAHYNQKVDMYSLGIIVYEMCCPRFETAMERKEVLSDLRRSPVLIRQFEPPKGQLKLILELLDHDAKRRPSAAEILKNGYLIFDEISMNPNTTSDANTPTIRPARDDSLSLVRRTNLLDVMKIKGRKIFELHGGTYTSAEFSPLTMLASVYFEYLVENSSIHPKIYSFNEIHNRTSDVIALYNYARFDMVFPDSVPANLTMTVEALEIAYEFIHSFSGWVNISDFVIRLTHSKIISAVATFQTAYQSGYFDENLMDLPRTDDVSIKQWKEVIQMNDESENVHILSLIRHSKTDSAYNDLTRLVNILKSRKMKCPVVIASKLDERNQYSETVFQIVCENKVIASGDRYRLPARQTSNSENHSIKQQSVVGVTIFFTHFTDILEPKNIFLSKFEVLICTVSCNMLLKEKLDLAKKLREVGIRCTISHYKYRNLRAIERYVEKTMVHYAVLLKKSKLERDHQVTLYSRISGNNFQEEDIAMENIVPYLKKTIEQSSLAQFLSF